MTGAYNRRAGYRFIEEAIVASKEDGENLIVAYVDIDGLKKVNDTFGHQEGDHLIKDVAKELIKGLKGTGKVVRVGGDEFLLLFKGPSLTTIEKLMEIISETTKERAKRKNRPYTIDFSIGYSVYNQQDEIDTFVDKADEKMYESRLRKGKRSQ